MWIFTPDGYYSVVQKPQDRKRGTLTIRARNREDMDALVQRYFPDAKPWRLKHSDYEWRIRVPQEDWAQAVARMALEIDYDNFKTEVGRRQGHKRASIYGRVWSVLLDLESKRRWMSFKPDEPIQLPLDPAA